MAKRRGYKRDRLGRFASGAGGAVAGAAAGAAVGGVLGSKQARRRYIPGSLKAESHVGTSADGKFTGAKIGARYTAPGGREVVVKGIIGVSTPKTSKPTPPPSNASAAKAAMRGGKAATGQRATAAMPRVRNSVAGSPAGRTVRR